MNAGEWDWYKVANLTVQSLASVATVAMVWIAGCELNTAKVARQEVDTLQKEAILQKASLSNALARVDLYGDIIAAEGGDRWAYTRVVDKLSQLTNLLDRADFLRTRLEDTVTQKYSGKPELNLLLKHIMFDPDLVENDDAQMVAMLKSEIAFDRICAVNSIFRRRLNRLIPTLIDIIEHDPDINVVQYALYATLQTIGIYASEYFPKDCIEEIDFNNVLKNPNSITSLIRDAWDSVKEVALKQHPLCVKVFTPTDKRYAPVHYLHDDQDNKDFTFPTKENDSVPRTFTP